MAGDDEVILVAEVEVEVEVGLCFCEVDRGDARVWVGCDVRPD